jgi:alpha-L-rhamnosidase
VCDLGQNIAGFVRLALEGEPGQTLTLRHAERLNPDRTIYTTNLRGARATDTYVCRGGGIERWSPRFTFHGFQYVEITGLGRAPRPGELVGLAVTSDTPYVGTLETSEPALTRLMENIRWTQRMNFIDIPTDCPQRDERLGWTGDAQIYAHTATLNADVQAFFTKWLTDLLDAQRADGQLPMVAPLKVAGDDGGPAWADAGVIVPLVMYQAYGDRRLLERQYPSMKKFLDFCEQRSGEDCLPPEEFHCFGDWVSVGSNTPTVILYTAYFAHCAKLMERAATILGKADDARHYAELFERVKRAFNTAYVAADGQIHGDTQCVYALAIAFELVDGPLRDEAARRLVADIEAHGGHFTTGFVGTKDLLVALSKVGRVDVAYRLLLNRTYPSWLFSIEHGATSIWERWDGWTPEKGFQDPGMNSFAHYSFGSVAQWMFETLGGIRAEEPGFARVHLAPRPGGGLGHARTRYDSVRGPIEVAWRRAGEELELEVEVPPNVGATLVLPMEGEVLEGGRELASAPGVRVRAGTGEHTTVELVSGRYHFRGRARHVPLW